MHICTYSQYSQLTSWKSLICTISIRLRCLSVQFCCGLARCSSTTYFFTPFASWSIIMTLFTTILLVGPRGPTQVEKIVFRVLSSRKTTCFVCVQICIHEYRCIFIQHKIHTFHMIGDIDHNKPTEWITAHEQQVKKLRCLLSFPACFTIFVACGHIQKKAKSMSIYFLRHKIWNCNFFSYPPQAIHIYITNITQKRTQWQWTSHFPSVTAKFTIWFTLGWIQLAWWCW